MYQSRERDRDRRHLGSTTSGLEFYDRDILPESDSTGLVYTGPVLCYSSKVNHSDLMTKQEELALIEAAQADDQKALNQILDKYERLCHKLARKFSFTATNHDHEDLVQEGRIGLIQAIRTFDPTVGASPLTWFYYHVRGQIASAGRSDRKQPKYPHSIEDCPRAYNVEDPAQEIELHDDLPRNLVSRLIEECCGGMHTKRAKIVMDRYGLLGRQELRNCECAEKYGITKYAVTSHTASFKRKAREMFPHLEAFV